MRFGSAELATVLGFLKPQQTAFAPTDAQREQAVETGEAVEWSGVNTQYNAPISGWSSSGAFMKRIVAPYHARFDNVQYFNIQSNLADGGLYGNNGVAQNVRSSLTAWWVSRSCMTPTSPLSLVPLPLAMAAGPRQAPSHYWTTNSASATQTANRGPSLFVCSKWRRVCSKQDETKAFPRMVPPS